MRRDTAGLLSAGVTRATLGLRVGMEYLERMGTMDDTGQLDIQERRGMKERLAHQVYLALMDHLVRMGFKETKDYQDMMALLDSKETWGHQVQWDLLAQMDQEESWETLDLLVFMENLEGRVPLDLLV